MEKNSTLNKEKVNDYIVNWLKNYAESAQVKGFVVGISGGIDSALTSTLCAQTGLTTLCVEMPIHQVQSHVSRAQEHIGQLKSQFKNVIDAKIDLTPVFESFKSQIPLTNDEAKHELSLANTRQIENDKFILFGRNT